MRVRRNLSLVVRGSARAGLRGKTRGRFVGRLSGFCFYRLASPRRAILRTLLDELVDKNVNAHGVAGRWREDSRAFEDGFGSTTDLRHDGGGRFRVDGARNEFIKTSKRLGDELFMDEVVVLLRRGGNIA